MTDYIKAFKNNLASKKGRVIIKWCIISFCIISSLVGIYLLINILYVRFMPAPSTQDETKINQQIEDTALQPEIIPKENMLEIPKISLRVKIYEGNASVLEKGMWHRYPERGDPVKGGNFILSGHRLSIGLTPEGTRRKSPLYHIDKVKIGDEIIIYWKKIKYTYKVKSILSVKPNNIRIEDPRENAILTLYTCSLNGAHDNRVVLLGELIEN